ncbi:DUF6607 family protein [Haloferula chungangensis]|uniref:DUF6607 family protein n=1 Tax=Haloferula chungangensis TaxID=1048331 RepID=A0ABW2LD71_9BACT
MKAIPLILVLAAPVLAGDPPSADREAILAMAGTYDITFHFEETAAVAPGYEIKTKPYHEKARELVTVAENEPDRITLQHLLFVPDKKGGTRVIKHWAQVWTWEDTEILDYAGSEDDLVWKKHSLSPDAVAGTWSQLITQVDDTPRYESTGRWIHQDGESSWQSEPTRRPLPRREYSKRDDYDYLRVINRHTLTPTGWVHQQDNRKVVDREGEKRHILCHEAGLNTYTRVEDEKDSIAENWWKENAPFWNEVRSFWIESGEQAPSEFTYSTHTGGEGLSKLLARLEEEKPAPDAIVAALQPYIISK